MHWKDQKEGQPTETLLYMSIGKGDALEVEHDLESGNCRVTIGTIFASESIWFNELPGALRALNWILQQRRRKPIREDELEEFSSYLSIEERK